MIDNARTSTARLCDWARGRPSPNSPPSWDQVRSPQVIPSPLIQLFNDTSTRGTTNDTFELSETTPKQPTTNNDNNNDNNNNSNNNNNGYLQPIDNRQAPIIQLFPTTASATYNHNNDNNDDEFESAEEDVNNNNNNDNNNGNDNNNDNNKNPAVIDQKSSYYGASAAAAVVGHIRRPHSYYDARDSNGNFINWPRGEYSSDSDPDDTLYDKRYNSYATVASIHSKMS